MGTLYVDRREIELRQEGPRVVVLEAGRGWWRAARWPGPPRRFWLALRLYRFLLEGLDGDAG